MANLNYIINCLDTDHLNELNNFAEELLKKQMMKQINTLGIQELFRLNTFINNFYLNNNIDDLENSNDTNNNINNLNKNTLNFKPKIKNINH